MSRLVQRIIDSEVTQLEQLFTRKGKIYTFLNPVSYLVAMKHKELFSQFDGVFADGILLVKAIKLLYGAKVKRRSFDLTSIAPELFKYASANNKSVYIVASKQEEVETTCGILKEKFEGLNIAGFRNGFFANQEEIDNELAHINQLNPDYVIAGLGIYKQENFLLALKRAGYKGVAFTCGGFIHQTTKGYSGYYPAWVDRHNLRFAYRMWKEPHTRKRYAKATLVFPLRFAWEKVTGK